MTKEFRCGDQAIQYLLQLSPLELRQNSIRFDSQYISCDDLYRFWQDVERHQLDFRPLQVKCDIGVPPVFFEEKTVKDQRSMAQPQVSIVIPSLGRYSILQKTLDHLASQNLKHDQFEVILVSDGLAPDFLNHHELSIVHLQITRSSPCFAAGLLRNLGVAKARAEILIFLDNDIIVPPNFLQNVLALHYSYDVLQYPRFHIRNLQEAGSQNSYWLEFYSQKEWAQLPQFWKYTSTSCLSVKRQHFESAGGFSDKFQSYGFEDTYLGYKLSSLHLNWKIGDLQVKHLLDPDENPRAHISYFKKMRHMERSAKVFYFLTMDADFYQDFFPLLGGHLKLRWLLTRIAWMSFIPTSLVFILSPIYLLLRPWIILRYLHQKTHPLRYQMKSGILHAYYQGRWFFSHPLSWIEQKYPILFKFGVRPCCKIYYFSRYQIQSKLMRKTFTNESSPEIR